MLWFTKNSNSYTCQRKLKLSFTKKETIVGCVLYANILPRDFFKILYYACFRSVLLMLTDCFFRSSVFKVHASEPVNSHLFIYNSSSCFTEDGLQWPPNVMRHFKIHECFIGLDNEISNHVACKTGCKCIIINTLLLIKKKKMHTFVQQSLIELIFVKKKSSSILLKVLKKGIKVSTKIIIAGCLWPYKGFPGTS